jgi:hypothetical protein
VDVRDERVRCPACDTDQEAPEPTAPQRCLVCGSSLGSAANGAALEAAEAADQPSLPDVFDLGEGEGGGDLGIPEEAPAFHAAELDEIAASEKRATSLVALVPFYGPWRLARSDLHAPEEKLFLGALSTVLSVLVGVLLWRLAGAPEPATAVHARVAADLERLRALAGQYRREYGSDPDAETWQRSADRADLRFYDPWGRVYRYERAPSGFRIGTLGRDGARGGNAEDADAWIESAHE